MIIGMAGAAGCGKSTVAEHLHARHKFVHLALAAPLYRMVAALTGRTVAQLQRRDAKEEPIEWVGKSPRQLMQLLGTEFGRGILGEDVWIKCLFREMDAIETYCGHPVDFVVADVRFDNEAEAIRSRGGVVWRVERAGVAPVSRHSSEAGVAAADLVIPNDGDLAALEAAVDAAVAGLQAGTMRESA